MAIAVGGFLYVMIQSWKKRQVQSLHLLIGLWMMVPVLRVSLPRAVDFDGIRHWLEFVPAVAIFAGIGGSKAIYWLTLIIRKVWRRLNITRFRRHRPIIKFAVICLYFMPVLIWNYRYHPYQVVYFNRLIGGLPGAQAMDLPEATDYWGSCYRQGLKWINAHALKNAYLLVGVGEHIVHATAKIWLRPDILNVSLTGEPDMPVINSEQLLDMKSDKSHVYLMYITRKDHYSEFVKTMDAHHDPVYEILVENAPILKILKIK
jgi:hypothetical protein